MGERADGKAPDKAVSLEKPKSARAWVTRAEAVATLALACVFVVWVAFIVIQQGRAGRDIRLVPGADDPALSLINLNDAGAPELMLLPGVGRARAERIVNWRAEHGPFHALEEVRTASGMPVRALDGIRNLVTLGVAPPEPLPQAAYAEPESED